MFFTPILLVCCELLDGHEQVIFFTSRDHFKRGKCYHTSLQSTLLPIERKYYFRISFSPYSFVFVELIELCDLRRK